MKLSDPLLAGPRDFGGGQIPDFQISHDTSHVVYIADQDVSRVFELWAAAGALACPTAPVTGCQRPGKSTLVVQDKEAGGTDPDKADKIVWRSARGSVDLLGDLGDPMATTSYSLCLYDETGGVPTLVATAEVPPAGTCDGEPCWKRLGSGANPAGYRYASKSGVPEGIRKIVLERRQWKVEGDPGQPGRASRPASADRLRGQALRAEHRA